MMLKQKKSFNFQNTHELSNTKAIAYHQISKTVTTDQILISNNNFIFGN